MPLPPSPIPIVSASVASHQGSSSRRVTVKSLPSARLRGSVIAPQTGRYAPFPALGISPNSLQRCKMQR